MSAYALPGLLFPPLPSCFDAYGDRNSSNNNSSSNSANIPNYHHHHQQHQHHHTTHNHDRINVNLYLTKTNPNHMNGKGDSSSKPVASLCKETSCHLPQNLSVSKVSSISNCGMNFHHQISIIDAKIDAIRLIKSFMSTPSSSNTHLRRRPYSSSHHQSSTSDFYEDFMIFTFQIVQSNIEDNSDDDPTSMTLNNNHNTITITRTLQQILQFYDDVCQYDSDIPNLRKLLHYDIPNCVNTRTPQSVPHQHRSFAYLQDQIRTYTPVIEQWIRMVGRSIFELPTPSHDNNNNKNITTTTTTNSLCQIWNDFVTHPVYVPSQEDDDNDEGNRRLHPPPSSSSSAAAAAATIITTTGDDSMVVSTVPLLPLRRHPTSSSSHCSSTTGSSRRRSHSKKQTMKPRRIVSMESIDEEEME